MLDLDRYQKWLADSELSPSTQLRYWRDARQIIHWIGEERELPARLWPAARKLALWAAEEEVVLGLGPAFEQLLQPETMVRASRDTRVRRQAATSFTDAEWKTLAHRILADTSYEARVLELCAVTGLRIGDVLRLQRESLDEGVETGVVRLRQKARAAAKLRWRTLYTEGAPDSWKRLHAEWAQSSRARAATVAEWLCPDATRPYQCAYARCRRRLMKLGEGLHGRIHLHRLRRTVAMQIFRTTGSLQAVKQTLGQSSLRVTERYIDEEQPGLVADTQKKLRETFIGGKP